MRRTLRLSFLALVSSLLLFLTACTGIPVEGSVQQGSAVVQADSGVIEFIPAGPLEDGTIEQILRGFIEAASSPVSDYAIARQYLTPSFATRWDANSAVHVDSGLRSITQTDTTAAELEFTLSATVDAQGRYAQAPANERVTYPFTFEEVEGQWRISSAPDGVVIDRFTFDQVYASHPLYFFDSTQTLLVPDVRYFPNGASSSTRIMKALLVGPSPWLAEGGAVVSAYPPGTALVADSVPVTRGVASVDLNENALNTDSAGIRKMKQQATASLQSVDNISSVDLLVNGTEQNALIADTVDAVMPPSVDSRALVLTSDRYGYISGGNIEQSSQLAQVMVALQPTAISVGFSGQLAAVLSPQGASFVRANAETVLADAREGLIAPSLDPFGYMWSVPANDPIGLLAVSTNGEQREVTVPWKNADEILSVKVSRDGARVVALVRDGAEYLLLASSVVRGEKSVPVSVGAPIELSLAEGVPVDIAWVDPTTVASLASSAEGTSHVVAQMIGGGYILQSALTAEEPISLSGANNVAGLRVLTAGGTLLSLRGGSLWQAMFVGVKTQAVKQ
ncbi:hypothetical protein M2119_000052 [Aurantimicrobium minutum]|uniref:GerMN domain-containing protein n=1 Tax=Aurantimicrobium minutum TaxID=708131 RepID=UPI002472E96F|nr:LpqB family beta-propeller domain-containing protein [Aurantimicrobium minutum]MDH6531815.1 hypothetical protein [Aurantimicrobium minutum]